MYQNSGFQQQAQPVPPQAGGPTPIQQAQQPAPQLDTNALLEQQRQLDNFKNQLIQVYNELKAKDELVNALKSAGVDSADDFKAYQQRLSADANKQKNPPQTQAEELFPKTTQQEPPVEGQSENEKNLQQRLDRLERTAMEQQHIIDRNTLREQVRSSINENDYPMLSRSLDDGLLDNIMYNRLQYQNQNKKELPLEEALKYSEQNLQAVFKRLGGEVNPVLSLNSAKPKVGAGEQQSQSQNQAAESVLGAEPVKSLFSPQPSQLPPYSGSGVPSQTQSQQQSKITAPGFHKDREFNELLAEKGIQN